VGAAIIGTGSYLPSRRLTNADLIALGVDTTHDWIVSHAGIEQRFWATDAQSTSDLALCAAQRALERAGVRASDLRLTICATSSPDYPLPATASLVQHGLGAAGGAFDINGVCSGFVSALATAFALCEQAGGPILVIGADTYSRWLSPRTRSTAVFFGDGAGAVVVAPTPSTSLRSLAFASDGAQFDKIIVRAGGSRRPARLSGVTEEELTIGMDGRAVWQYATEAVPAIVRQVVERAGLHPSDIDWLIPHQANQRMLEEIVDVLGMPRERLVSNIQQVANTAAASIPIALDHAVQEERLKRGDTVTLVGFGGGLAAAALCLSWVL